MNTVHVYPEARLVAAILDGRFDVGRLADHMERMVAYHCRAGHDCKLCAEMRREQLVAA